MGFSQEYRWLLPSALEAPDPGRRSTRDWLIDVLAFLSGFGFTVYGTIDLLRPEPTLLVEQAGNPAWLIWTDFACATVAAIGLWWRRTRLLIPLAIYCVVISIFTVAAAFTLLIVLFTIAVHRKFLVLAIFFVSITATNAVFPFIRPETGRNYWETAAWGTVFLVIVCLWGMVVRARRQLLASYRDRAERAEAEQQLRVAQARTTERNRIAREMHDVLAHRISLLSLHAGALEIKPDAAPDDVANAAGVIRASAHQALQDLREVIGVLRDDRPEGAPEPPQPTLGELPALAEESRSAGVKVSLDVAVEPEAVPAGTGRTAYRIVQEGLTNARKHAPGALVRVNVAGSAGDGLVIEVRNPWPIGGNGTSIPGTGTGLIGLTERTALAGGRLSHGRTPQNEFALTAWLPWPT
ncbi:two-component sensor histidine kinase [Paractinoplanes abujensis]|uniref:histidine kinase n=1 Tax=Paractinoplanes abujensis TaxID=882441 RepID=A0A7W7CKY7_9ACTN|nr:histidine kinase [Actinoplanes abujensis]MBB4690392.1 signal transduction histidine kinase [Actinoplanes abujensis]GID21156.1 two-component sensor histidine kinase [Actinoplanes abujensis]